MPAISGKASYHNRRRNAFSNPLSLAVFWVMGTVMIFLITIFPTVLMYYLIGKTIVSAFKGG